MSMRMKTLNSFCVLLAAAIFAGCASTGGQASAKAYPLKTCIVTDEALDDEPTVFVHNGQQIKICCDGCKEDFDKEPAKYLTKLAGK